MNFTPPDNLVFVCVDCLRNDFLASKHADTPFLDRIVAEGIYYPEMFATATTTTPAVASFMTGLYSERNGIQSLDRGPLREDVDTLAEVLDQAGFNTYADVTGPLVKETGINRGFDEFEYRDQDQSIFGTWKNRLLDHLDGLSKPFFYYIHLWELHEPIDVPRAFDDERYGNTPYARALSALDREIDAIWEALPDDTVLVIHGDHGESITWRGNLFHKLCWSARAFLRYILGIDTRSLESSVNDFIDRRWESEVSDHFIEDSHGENVFDFTSNVPLAIYSSAKPKAQVNAQCRQIDIFPTLLELLQVEYDVDVDGKSLLPSDEITDRDAYIRACGRSLLREQNWSRAIRSESMKYVEYPDRDWEPELYDLESDPKERRRIDDASKISQLRRRLPTKRLEATERLEIDDLLRDLGYR